MINLKYITKARLKDAYNRRNFNDINLDELFELYEYQKKKNTLLESLYAQKNKIISNNIESIQLKKDIKILEQEVDDLKHKLQNILINMPNVLHDIVPDGLDGIIIKQNGNLIFHKHHYDMNIIKPCSISGSRFVVLESKIATLERALSQFMINTVINNGFTEYSIPCLIKASVLEKTGHLPKEEVNMFHDNDLYLIPTSEVSLVSYKSNTKFDDIELPIKMTGLTECFRKEAGSSGRDTKGLIRLHQFKKCEMVVLCDAEKSYEIHEEMVNISCSILEQLEIPYRIKLLGAQDIGFTSAKTYDIEIPIGNEWREVASLSNCETFQSIGLNLKSKNNEYLHTLNGSSLAVGRTLASLLEVHYNNHDNTINIPKCLNKYLDFDKIELDIIF